MSFSGLSFRRTPATLAILVSLVAFTVLFWFLQGRGIDRFALTLEAIREPWRLVTYVWAAMPLGNSLSLVSFAFTILWMASIGPNLERTMGSWRFGVAWLAAGLFGGVAVLVGFMGMGVPGVLAGPWLAISAISVLWCAQNPKQVINMWGILPMSTKALALVTGVTDVLLVGAMGPVVGFAAAIPLLFWWAFGLERFSWLPCSQHKPARLTDQPVVIGGQVYREEYFDDVRERERERAERERLRKLLGE